MNKKPLMIGLLLSAFLWALLIAAAFAAPILVSDPYPAASVSAGADNNSLAISVQPDDFVITIAGVDYFSPAVPVGANGAVTLLFNLTGVPASAWLIGENTIKVKARKGTQESEATPLAVTVKRELAAPHGVHSRK